LSVDPAKSIRDADFVFENMPVKIVANRLRRYLEELNEEAIKKPEKRVDSEKAKNLSDDITQMRLKKIVSLASSGREKTGQILRSLTKEEKHVYDCLYKIISEWKTEILNPQGGDKT